MNVLAFPPARPDAVASHASPFGPRLLEATASLPLPRPRYSGAVVDGSRLCLVTLAPSADGWILDHKGTGIHTLQGLEQPQVRQFGEAIDAFALDGDLQRIGLKSLSGVDNMLTWMLYQKIETVLQTREDLEVELILAEHITDWLLEVAPVLPIVSRSESARSLMQQAIETAAYVGTLHRRLDPAWKLQ